MYVCTVIAHSERILKLPPDILEAMLYLLEIVLPVVIEDVQVSGEVVELDLTKVLWGGRGSKLSVYKVLDKITYICKIYPCL